MLGEYQLPNKPSMVSVGLGLLLDQLMIQDKFQPPASPVVKDFGEVVIVVIVEMRSEQRLPVLQPGQEFDKMNEANIS